MKIALSILLGISILLNIFLAGWHYFSMRNVDTYDRGILSAEQIEILMIRERDDHPDIFKTIEDYHRFIKKIQGKKLVIVEKD